MVDESKAVALRQNGELEHSSADKTRIIWASAGADIKSPEVARALAFIGDRYSLDPALGEVMLLGNKVYVTAEGYLRIAEQQPSYEGYELNPMTEQERKDAKVGADEFAYVAKVYRKDRRFPSIGYGVASDGSISMAPMRIFKREVAQKRALHRALRMAFRAGIPDYEDAIDAIERGDSVSGQISAPIDAPALPAAPDWPKFWLHMKGIGAEAEEVHEALGVESVRDWPGSLDEAIAKVERYVLERDLGEPLEEAPAPVASKKPAVTVQPQTRDQLNAAYDAEFDKAQVLGVAAKARQLTWAESYCQQELQGLRNRNRAAEDAGERTAGK